MQLSLLSATQILVVFAGSARLEAMDCSKIQEDIAAIATARHDLAGLPETEKIRKYKVSLSQRQAALLASADECADQIMSRYEKLIGTAAEARPESGGPGLAARGSAAEPPSATTAPVVQTAVGMKARPETAAKATQGADAEAAGPGQIWSTCGGKREHDEAEHRSARNRRHYT